MNQQAQSDTVLLGIKPGFKLVKDVVFAHKKMLYVAILCLLLGTTIDVSLVVVIKQILDGVKDHAEYTIGNTPIMIAIALFLVVCLREVVAVLQNHRLALLTFNIGASLKRKVVISHRSLGFEDLTKISKNDILMLFRNVDDVVDFIKQGLVVTIREFMTLVGTIIAMLYLNTQLALAFLLVTPFAYSMVRSMGIKSKKSAGQALIARNALNQHVIHGHEHWIAFHTNRLARDDYFSRLSSLLAGYKSHGMSLTMASVWLSMLTQFWIGIMLSAIIYLMLTGAMGATTGTMAAFLYAVGRLRAPAKRIADLRSVYDQALTSSDSIYKFVSSKVGIKHYHQANPITWNKIMLDEVGYSSNTQKVLCRPISCEFKVGETILLSGASGVGKTTLLHMLALLLNPTSGNIRIDDDYLTQDVQESWFESMVYVEQFSTLLSATMRDNLTAFASADDEMCIRALQNAGLGNWINKNSLNTMIGDGGVPLSGGERQRVILARIMLQCNGKSVVLLDEVFAALDVDGGFNLTKILLEYLEGSLVVAVSHKLNTYKLFDRLLVLDQDKGLMEVSHDAFSKKLQKAYGDSGNSAVDQS